VAAYEEGFDGLSWLRTPGAIGDEIVPFLYYVRVPAGSKDTFREHLTEKAVDTGIHWIPGHWFSLLQDARRGPLAVTDRVGEEIVTLPLHSDMTESTIGRVIDAVRSFQPA
jgi:dTDP-4-amino-4,6-dideoxygalactose transaminase